MRVNVIGLLFFSSKGRIEQVIKGVQHTILLQCASRIFLFKLWPKAELISDPVYFVQIFIFGTSKNKTKSQTLWASVFIITIIKLATFSWTYLKLTSRLKHRNNCGCCPGHYLIVNRYSSINVMIQVCQNSQLCH